MAYQVVTIDANGDRKVRYETQSLYLAELQRKAWQKPTIYFRVPHRTVIEQV